MPLKRRVHAGATRSTGSFQHRDPGLQLKVLVPMVYRSGQVTLQIPKGAVLPDPADSLFTHWQPRASTPLACMPASGHWHASARPRLAPEPDWHVQLGRSGRDSDLRSGSGSPRPAACELEAMRRPEAPARPETVTPRSRPRCLPAITRIGGPGGPSPRGPQWQSSR
jgi:hypothetical protein